MNDDTMFAARVRTLATEATALPAPAEAWERIAERVAHGEEVILPPGDAAAPAATRAAATLFAGWQPTRRAAAAVLIAGGLGVAAALPASPVRDWLARVFNGAAPPSASPTAPTAPAPAAAEIGRDDAADDAETTLIMDTADGVAIVSLLEPASGVRIRVRFTDGDGLEVNARGRAALGQFRSARGQLTIADAGAGELVLTVPNRLAHLRVLVDGRAYLTRQDGQVRVHSPAADTVGSEIIMAVIR